MQAVNQSELIDFKVGFYTPILLDEQAGLKGYLIKFHNFVEKFFDANGRAIKLQSSAPNRIHTNAVLIDSNSSLDASQRSRIETLVTPILLIFKTISYLFINDYHAITQTKQRLHKEIQEIQEKEIARELNKKAREEAIDLFYQSKKITAESIIIITDLEKDLGLDPTETYASAHFEEDIVMGPFAMEVINIINKRILQQSEGLESVKENRYLQFSFRGGRTGTFFGRHRWVGISDGITNVSDEDCGKTWLSRIFDALQRKGFIFSMDLVSSCSSYFIQA